ncbi:hypothetical protein AAF712_008524 [Marasmius tenuissimus]|uniref:Uncharacterized protein n=1 Tax=Marasmius tenuissimus TaxID=585030 RepID=A0ABR2ZTU6_9AGAR
MNLSLTGFSIQDPTVLDKGSPQLDYPFRAPGEDVNNPAYPYARLSKKTEVEEAVIISHLQKAELKWAWGCLFALLVVTVFGVAAGVTVRAVLRL